MPHRTEFEYEFSDQLMIFGYLFAQFVFLSHVILLVERYISSASMDKV